MGAVGKFFIRLFSSCSVLRIYGEVMASKTDLLKTISNEFSKAQKTGLAQWRPPKGEISFPPLLPVGNGEQLAATNDLLKAVDGYANLLLRNSPELKSSFSSREFRSVVELAFGRTLNSLQSNHPNAGSLGTAVDATIQDEIDSRKKDTGLLVGCWLFEDLSAYPITLGPVAFQPRLAWLGRQILAGNLSKTTARRLQKTWSGERVGRRKSGWDSYKERAIGDAIDRCPIICQVTTHGLSSDLVRQKGLLAARIAMAALSLPWQNSQQALERMNLIYDGPPRSRHYAVMSGSRFGSGSSVVTTPFGQHSQGPLKPSLTQFQPTFDIIGEALAAYVNPHATVQRPQIANAIFLSAWWFYEGCREISDQMAVTAFAASLDALAAGGNAGGIKELIEARLGIAPSGSLMNDGRTASSVVDAVYNAARSRFIHGSSVDFVEDWTALRTTAMVVSRLMLLQITYWLHQNPAVYEVKDIRKK